MVARVVPNSVSMVAQTAPPTSVTVRAGRNRRFFLMRFGQGTPSGETAPQLGGQTPTRTGSYNTFPHQLKSFHWDETKIQSAGVGINRAGSVAISAFAESGITEKIWCWGTIENASGLSDDTVGGSLSGGSSLRLPTSPLSISDLALDYILMPVMFAPATSVVDSIEDSLKVVGPVAQTSYVASLYESMQGGLDDFLISTEAAWTSMQAVFEVFGAADPKVSGNELPIHAVQTRSMDAKTIADRYNLGVAKQEDYIFNDRKFYQDGTTS